MAFDPVLAERIRDLLIEEAGVTEMRMFGGLAFLVGGHLAIAASREGGVLVRIDPATSDAMIERTGAQVAVMRGRPMQGWLRVGAEGVRTQRLLAAWVKRSTEYARSMPPKAQPAPRSKASSTTPPPGDHR